MVAFDLPASHARTAETCVPFLVSSREGMVPAGASLAGLPPLTRVDPQRVASAAFLARLRRLNDLCFGPVGLGMPGWVFYDCAAVPGAVFGFAVPAGRLTPWARGALLAADVDDAALVPVSMCAEIPMLQEGAWHNVSLCSVNQVSPGAAPAGLRLLSLAGALAALDVQVASGVTQWRSPELAVVARLAPVDVVTAFTPAHTNPRSLTWQVDVTAARLAGALSTAPADARADLLLDADDEAALRALQLRIEAGAVVRIVGPPQVDGALTLVPLTVGPGSAP